LTSVNQRGTDDTAGISQNSNSNYTSVTQSVSGGTVNGTQGARTMPLVVISGAGR
jgi:hypothetical protein